MMHSGALLQIICKQTPGDKCGLGLETDSHVKENVLKRQRNIKGTRVARILVLEMLSELPLWNLLPTEMLWTFQRPKSTQSRIRC